MRRDGGNENARAGDLKIHFVADIHSGRFSEIIRDNDPSHFIDISSCFVGSHNNAPFTFFIIIACFFVNVNLLYN